VAENNHAVVARRRISGLEASTERAKCNVLLCGRRTEFSFRPSSQGHTASKEHTLVQIGQRLGTTGICRMGLTEVLPSSCVIHGAKLVASVWPAQLPENNGRIEDRNISPEGRVLSQEFAGFIAADLLCLRCTSGPRQGLGGSSARSCVWGAASRNPSLRSAQNSFLSGYTRTSTPQRRWRLAPQHGLVNRSEPRSLAVCGSRVVPSGRSAFCG
jgi:hypothetical protein